LGFFAKDANGAWTDAVQRQQIVLVGGEQFLECLVAGGVEGPASGSADSMRDLGHALNLGRVADNPRSPKRR
jgi:hypothetical protein